MAGKGEILSVSDEVVSSKIYYVRGHKVMMDSDLALLYHVQTKQLKRQVNRNRDRFPEDFMFYLTQTEFDNLRSQFGTSNWGGIRYLPMVFTEHGILMLSSILNSKQAIQVNIQIVRVFSRIRQMLFDNTELRLAMEELRKKTDKNSKSIEVIFQYLDKLIEQNEHPPVRKAIGYEIPKRKQG